MLGWKCNKFVKGDIIFEIFIQETFKPYDRFIAFIRRVTYIWQ